LTVVTLLTILLIILVVVYILIQGLPGHFWEFLTGFPSNVRSGGILRQLLERSYSHRDRYLSVPLDWAAIYLAGMRLTTAGPAIRLAIINLAGIPSSGVRSVWARAVCAVFSAQHFSRVSDLSIATLPVIISTAEGVRSIHRLFGRSAFRWGHPLARISACRSPYRILTGKHLGLMAAGETARSHRRSIFLRDCHAPSR
jgi:ABC-type phosphate transport system permease subunit